MSPQAASVRCGLAVALGAVAMGCDLPPSRGAVGTIHAEVVAPADGRLERDGVIELALDALIEPRTLVGADAALVSGERELGVALRFEPVARILVADPAARLLDPDVDYVLRVEGPQGFDGALLEPVAFPLRVTRDLAVPPSAPSYAEVQVVLARCAPCHQPGRAELGLDVTDLEGTAIGVPADEVAQAGAGAGLGGALRIEPFHPERSYLLYKMMGEGPIVGAPMGASDAPDVPLDEASLRVVSRWIAGGARLEP
ncbi:MAG: hypothetical protein K1X94_29305 [Sandaracinaceae bacterium]|nr:hypothetical protein [Sandaracinaceae bacterium]